MEFQKRLFTHEQLERIHQLMDAGLYTTISSVISNLTPEQEVEIQKIVDHFVGNEMPEFTSKVEEKWRGVNINSPEQEEQMQKEMKEEYETWEKSLLESQKTKESSNKEELSNQEKLRKEEEKEAKKAAKEAEKAAKAVKDLENKQSTPDLESLNSELDKQ